VSDLDFSFEELDSLTCVLDQTLEGLRSMKHSVHELATLVGHDGLASKVRDIADGFDNKRREVTEELQFLSDGFSSFSDTLKTLDQRIANDAMQAAEEMAASRAEAQRRATQYDALATAEGGG
jgi:hypothetical protein